MSHHTPRASRAEVRNPLLALPATQRILAYSPQVLADLAEILSELEADCKRRGDKAWATSKPPMANYWKSSATVVGHLRKVCRRRLKEWREGRAGRA